MAWKETRKGERRFLSNEEIHTFVPESIYGGYDALLGRVVLPYLQPEIATTFPERRGFNRDGKGLQQPILPAQIPLLLYDKKLMAPWLATPLVDHVQSVIY